MSAPVGRFGRDWGWSYAYDEHGNELGREAVANAGFPVAPSRLGGLTDEEAAAIELAGDLTNAVAAIIHAEGYEPVVAEGDIAELCAAIHVIQRMVGAQAAARAYPTRFRLLGRRVAKEPRP